MSDAELVAANLEARDFYQAAQDAAHRSMGATTLSAHVIDVSVHLEFIARMDERLDRAAAAVMETGEPGGHPSQHDQHCHMHYCTCGPAIKEANGGCDRLPGCGWPSAGGDGR